MSECNPNPRLPADAGPHSSRSSWGRSTGRPIIFYDQLGCGRSDAPAAEEAEYSVAASVRDLRSVLARLEINRYHLYGQSWGGLLAVEHVSTLSDGAAPLTLTISNTPSSVQLVEAEAGRLVEACGGDVAAFMQAHNCRLDPQPARLAEAYAHAGTIWRGSGAIAGLEADPAALARVRCPALCLRGEHDFVTEACVEGWQALPDVRFVTLEGCAHHALLEQPAQYLRALTGFLDEHDRLE